MKKPFSIKNLIIVILIITICLASWIICGGKIFQDGKIYKTYIGKEVVIVHYIVWRIWGEIIVSDDLTSVPAKLINYSKTAVLYEIYGRIYMIPTKYVKEIVLIEK